MQYRRLHYFLPIGFCCIESFHCFLSGIGFLFNTRSVLDFGITLGCIGFWYYFGVGAQLGILSRGDPIPVCEPKFTSRQLVSPIFQKVIHEPVLLLKAMCPLVEI